MKRKASRARDIIALMRTCEECGREIPRAMKAGTRFCRPYCRLKAHRRQHSQPPAGQASALPADLRGLVLDQVQARRARIGLPPLALDPALQRWAQLAALKEALGEDDPPVAVVAGVVDSGRIGEGPEDPELLDPSATKVGVALEDLGDRVAVAFVVARAA